MGAKRKGRRGNKGSGNPKKRSRLSIRKAVVNDLKKLAVKFLPGLSKGKKYGWNAKNRNPKVTAAGKALLIGSNYERIPFVGVALSICGRGSLVLM